MLRRPPGTAPGGPVLYERLFIQRTAQAFDERGDEEEQAEGGKGSGGIQGPVEHGRGEGDVDKEFDQHRGGAEQNEPDAEEAQFDARQDADADQPEGRVGKHEKQAHRGEGQGQEPVSARVQTQKQQETLQRRESHRDENDRIIAREPGGQHRRDIQK